MLNGVHSKISEVPSLVLVSKAVGIVILLLEVLVGAELAEQGEENVQ